MPLGMKVRIMLHRGTFTSQSRALLSKGPSCRARGRNSGLFLHRAGGQWRSHAKAHERELQEWDAETYKEWMGIVKMGKGTEAGLGIVPSILYWYTETRSPSIILMADFKFNLGTLLPLQLIPNYGGAQLSRISDIYHQMGYLKASNQQ